MRSAQNTPVSFQPQRGKLPAFLENDKSPAADAKRRFGELTLSFVIATWDSPMSFK
jgi:hypothetical protein